MPWKRVTPMDERKAFLEAYLQSNSSFSSLCQAFGISRKTGYKWIKRVEEEGSIDFQDRSRKPHHSPNQTPQALVDAVIKIRREYPVWGAKKIHRLLQDKGYQTIPSISTINAILKRNGMIDPEQARKHKAFTRFEHENPNDLWQIDFKGPIPIIGTKDCHPLTVLDDHSRFLLGLRACLDESIATAQAQMSSIFHEYGLPKRMLMDNGSAWKTDDYSRHTAFTVWLIGLGIKVTHSRPYHPQTQGKEERLHRTLQEELLNRRVFNSILEIQNNFDEWRKTYNYIRPHEALDMNVPASRYKKSDCIFPEYEVVYSYPAHFVLCKINESGRLRFQGANLRIGKPFAGRIVGVEQAETKGVYNVNYCGSIIRRVKLNES